MDFSFSALKKTHFEVLVTIITQFKEGNFLCLVSENTCVYTFPALPFLRKITGNPERGEVPEAQFSKGDSWVFQGPKLTFLGRHQLATEIFFSVAIWKNLVTKKSQ